MTYDSPLKAQLAAVLQGSGAAALVVELERRTEPPPLVPPRDVPWNVGLSQRISGLSPEGLCGSPLRDETAAKAFKSGLLLWNDDLDASHAMSQGIHTDTGSYWHGIMHRREPDYSNSKYWFNRVGEHATFADLKDAAVAVAAAVREEQLGRAVASSFEWNPMRFIDWCEEAARGGLTPAQEAFLRYTQLDEIRLLLAYSFQRATGRG